MRLAILAAILSFSFWGCGPMPYYQETHQISDGIWRYDDPGRYLFDITDTEQTYDLVAEIDHGTDFSYENLYVLITTTFPTGERIEDQVSLPFANAFGRWYGDCSAKRCELSIVLQSRIKFKDVGQHQITIEQYIRQDSLPALYGIGLAIYPVD